MTAYDAGSYTSFCIVPAGGMRVCIFDDVCFVRLGIKRTDCLVCAGVRQVGF